jgi:hypothetical protein
MAANRDWRDVIGGLVMIAIGLFWAIWAQEHYRLGTPTRMGPGWFPMYLGYVLAVIGALITLPAWFRQRQGDPVVIEWRPMIWITASVLVFAATVKWIGLTPAIFLQIGLCVLGDTKLGIVGTLILAALTAIACHLIFYVGLDVQLPPFVWPFQ